LIIKDLRGNLGTRLKKLDQGEYDAIILASAGLIRLKLPERIKQKIATDFMLPAAGQGAVGIECREDDEKTQALIASLNHSETASRVKAERAVNHTLQGGCQVPIGAFAQINHQQITINGLVGSLDGQTILKQTITGKLEQAEELGIKLAKDLIAQGADKILAEININD